MNQRTREFSSMAAKSPTAHHLCRRAAEMLRENGFKPLEGDDRFEIPEGDYFTLKGGSLLAFRIKTPDLPEKGLKIFGAHSDSPSLKVKPDPLKSDAGFHSLCVEIYGGPINRTWFDRPLSLAGKVAWEDAAGKIHSALFDHEKTLAVIPSLAIHLGKGNDLDPQKEMNPVLALPNPESDFDFDRWVLANLPDPAWAGQAKKLLAHDLFFYNAEPLSVFGASREFFLCPRLDNQASCYFLIQALLESPRAENALCVINDHEEIGSGTSTGARGPLLRNTLKRIAPNRNDYQRLIENSLVFSLDNAHATHPSHPEKSDPNHPVRLNGGLAVKCSAAQNYAGESEIVAFARGCCERAGIPLQTTVNRNDIRGGSTIGPLTATNVGCPALDLGMPTLGMHSALETGGVEDLGHGVATVKSLMENGFEIIRHD